MQHVGLDSGEAVVGDILVASPLDSQSLRGLFRRR